MIMITKYGDIIHGNYFVGVVVGESVAITNAAMTIDDVIELAEELKAWRERQRLIGTPVLPWQAGRSKVARAEAHRENDSEEAAHG